MITFITRGFGYQPAGPFIVGHSMSTRHRLFVSWCCIALFVIIAIIRPEKPWWFLLGVAGVVVSNFIRRPLGRMDLRAPRFMRRLFLAAVIAFVGFLFLVLLREYSLLPGWAVSLGTTALVVLGVPCLLWILYDDYCLFTGRVSPEAAQPIGRAEPPPSVSIKVTPHED